MQTSITKRKAAAPGVAAQQPAANAQRPTVYAQPATAATPPVAPGTASEALTDTGTSGSNSSGGRRAAELPSASVGGPLSPAGKEAATATATGAAVSAGHHLADNILLDVTYHDPANVSRSSSSSEASNDSWQQV